MFTNIIRAIQEDHVLACRFGGGEEKSGGWSDIAKVIRSLSWCCSTSATASAPLPPVASQKTVPEPEPELSKMKKPSVPACDADVGSAAGFAVSVKRRNEIAVGRNILQRIEASDRAGIDCSI